MKNELLQRSIVLGVLVLFVGASIIPSAVSMMEKQTIVINPTSGGYIQNLIDNASDGDTIYVPSGIYYENIIINKSISLIGEDKNTTIIDGGESGDVVNIIADWVNISGFTIQNSANLGVGVRIDMQSNYNTITANIISNCGHGIGLGGCYHNNIIKNIFTFNSDTDIYLGGSNYNVIIKNNISSTNDNGIYLYLSDYNTIIGNTISNKNYGIYIGGSDYNNITGNTISKNSFGLFLEFLIIFQHRQPCRKNNITKNNFFGYKQKTYCGGDWSNSWNQNHWNRPRFIPKLIIGVICVSEYVPLFPLLIPWFNFDMHPAQEPYDIPMRG